MKSVNSAVYSAVSSAVYSAVDSAVRSAVDSAVSSAVYSDKRLENWGKDRSKTFQGIADAMAEQWG